MIKITNNIITSGGISTKNSPNYTLESFMIANNKDYVKGIKVNTYLTKDNILIALDEPNMKQIGINKQYINNHTFSEISKLNNGTVVKRNSITTLEKIITTCNKKKTFIIVIDEDYKNNVITQKIKALKKMNPEKELLITSPSKNTIDNLLEEKEAKIGMIINENKDWQYSVDFYIVDFPKMKKEIIENKINNQTLVFINDINNKNDFNEVTNTFENIPIICNNVNCFINK